MRGTLLPSNNAQSQHPRLRDGLAYTAVGGAGRC